MPDDLKFERWINEVEREMLARGYSKEAVKNNDRTAWIMAFEEGCSPKDAVDEDLSNL